VSLIRHAHFCRGMSLVSGTPKIYSFSFHPPIQER
jgi:hypothetical protein